MKKMLMMLLALALLMSAALADVLPKTIVAQQENVVSMADAVTAAQESMAVLPAECLTRAELVEMTDGTKQWIVTMFDVASFYANGWVITVDAEGKVVNTITTDIGYFAEIYTAWIAEKGPQSLWSLEDKQLYDRLYAISPTYGMPVEGDMETSKALEKAIKALKLTDVVDYDIGYGYMMGSGDGATNGVWEVFFVKNGETMYKVNLDAVTGEVYYIEPDEEGNG